MSDEVNVSDPFQPRMRWEGFEDYVEGTAVLARNADRQLFGFRENGRWFEMVDGEEYAIEAFDPIEWCNPPGGAAQWAR